jgi:hypothetical protein
MDPSGRGTWEEFSHEEIWRGFDRVASCEECASISPIEAYGGTLFRNFASHFLDRSISSGRINSSAAWNAAV